MTVMPAEITYGHVTGRIILAVGDGPDADRIPDATPAAGTTVKITPKTQTVRLSGTDPVLIAKQPVTCQVDADGRLVDAQGSPGVWLVTGVYSVAYSSPSASIPGHDIEVTTAHTEAAPLNLVTAMPPGGPVLTASEYAEVTARLAVLEGAAPSEPQDTGWQPVTLANGWTVAPSVRRIGSQVYVNIRGLSGATATSTAVGSIPAGYRPDVIAGGLTRFGYTFRAVSISTGGAISLDDYSTGDGAAISEIFTYTSADPFP
jgi:hypothetical protein